ncbi:MAG: VOC family protein [Candidatus Binataceae bacterium]
MDNLKQAAGIIPAMRYRNAPAAIEWLCKALGFEKHLVVPADHNRVAHAQLTYGNAMIMLSSDRDGEFDRLMKHPDQIGGAVTQSVYVIVPDADVHYARAKASGAKILLELVDQDYGGRGYTCADPEGHVWSFGTYDPWEA